MKKFIGVDTKDNAESFLGYDYLNQPNLPLAELLSQTVSRLPPYGKITRFRDMVAVEAAIRLVDDLPDSDAQKERIITHLKSAQERMI